MTAAYVQATVDPIVARHVEWMRVRNMRVRTIYLREWSLYRLADWAGSPLLELTEDQLSAWQVARSKLVKSQSVKVETGHVREFYRWAVRERLRPDDPTVRLVTPRMPRRGPRPMTEASMHAALDGGDPEMTAIIGLAAYAGLRACEIAGLDWADLTLDDETPYLRVVEGKGGHSRIVPMSDHLIAILLALPTRLGPIIPRRDGRPGYNTAPRISQRARKHLIALEIPKPNTLHGLRHRFGTQLYRATRDPFLVGEIMGHRNADTTRGYVAIDPRNGAAGVQAIG